MSFEFNWHVLKAFPGDMQVARHLRHLSVEEKAACCTPWWIPPVRAQSAPLGEARRRHAALCREYDDPQTWEGYLLFADGEPAAWCRTGRRDLVPDLTARLSLPPDPAMHAIFGFHVACEFRSFGCSERLLALVLADLARSSVSAVQAYPCSRGREAPPADLRCGDLAMYRRAGFRIVREEAAFTVVERGLAAR